MLLMPLVAAVCAACRPWLRTPIRRIPFKVARLEVSYCKLVTPGVAWVLEGGTQFAATPASTYLELIQLALQLRDLDVLPDPRLVRLCQLRLHSLQRPRLRLLLPLQLDLCLVCLTTALYM